MRDRQLNIIKLFRRAQEVQKTEINEVKNSMVEDAIADVNLTVRSSQAFKEAFVMSMKAINDLQVESIQSIA